MHNSDLGLQRGTVKLLPHQSAWHKAFAAEQARLQPILRGHQIEHVGSTAVPGLAAKPIIDIAVAVDSLTEAETFIQSLAALDYEYKGEAGTPGRRFFAKGPEQNRIIYLHFGLPAGEFGSLVKFRDALRSHPQLVAEYQTLKLSLAGKFPNDRRAYTRGKSEFIHKVLQTL